MLKIGERNNLRALEFIEFGALLDDGEGGEILLPNRFVPENLKVGQTLEVFVCYDSEDRLIATTESPRLTVGQFAALRVVSLSKVGAFLDWGLAKDLLLPFAEQTHDLKEGDDVVVFAYLDKSGRISASMRLEKFADKNTASLSEDQPIDLLVAGRSHLGFKCVVDGRYIGMIFESEVFQKLAVGQKLKGFIRQVRPDGKLDLGLTAAGHRGADETGPKILSLLKENNGFYAISDKTEAETIYKLFGVSKKKFKIALGGLYKSRKITITPDGIRLV
jgi:uncharacterized protein